jgi:hypothetical protein
MVEILRDIDRDLRDLEGYYRTVPTSSALATVEDASPTPLLGSGRAGTEKEMMS